MNGLPPAMNRTDAVVCGIDPGLRTTGYAVVRGGAGGLSILDAGVCRFEPRAPLSRRLVAIEHDVQTILREHEPVVLAVEALYAHYKHPRTAVLMAHARGVILLAGAKRGLEVRSYGATTVKRRLTGNGRATKGQMQRAIQALLGMSAVPEPADLADAMAIALCCADDVRRRRVELVEVRR